MVDIQYNPTGRSGLIFTPAFGLTLDLLILFEQSFLVLFMDFWSCGQCWPSVGGKAGYIFGPMLSQQPGSDEGQVVAFQ